MKEFGAKTSIRVNLVPTKEMEQEARERVARALKITREHILESQTTNTPFSSFVKIDTG
jgi:hypothetical protein